MKYETEIDTAAGGAGNLNFTRHYNSLSSSNGMLGKKWRSPYESSLTLNALNGISTAIVTRPDGRVLYFTLTNGAWVADSDIRDSLAQTASGWVYSKPDGSTEFYSASGLLLSLTSPQGVSLTLAYGSDNKPASITDSFGHQLTFQYNDKKLLTTVTNSQGHSTSYGYDSLGNLASVAYPDGTGKQYHYENTSYPSHLTGISFVDSAGTANRYGTYTYTSSGKAASTEHTGGMEKYSLAYLSNLTTVTDAAGTKEDWSYSVNLGVYRLISRKNYSDNKVINQAYDANNNLTCRQDEEGKVTTHSYNSSNQRISSTAGQSGTCSFPASTSATRTTSYQYLTPTQDMPTVIESPSVYGSSKKRISISYNGNLPTVITQSGYAPSGAAVSRTISLGYNARGQVTSIDGARTDVSDTTTFSYYECTSGGACGQLQRITNALGQATSFDSYDATGRLLEMTDPNGLKTSYAYDARGRVTTISQAPPGGVARVTQYTYDAAGNVLTASLPTGLVLSYAYNAALKLTGVVDSLGNSVAYSYDLKGNRTQTYTYDPTGILIRAIDTAYDARNRANQVNDSGSITKQVFDAVGNLTNITDPNTVAANSSVATTNQYDALNRLTKTIDLLAGNTTYAYDVNDRVKIVQAANGASTGYEYDDLGNLTREISPDRGVTSYTYDAAGNVKTMTDARGVTVSYSYDALNRLTAASYPNSSENVTYAYDSGTGCTYGVGRLCQVTDAAGLSQYGYDAFGNVLAHARTELNVIYTTRYAYDNGNRVVSMTYPNGRVVSYGRDAKGNALTANVSLNGSMSPLIAESRIRADGQLAARRFGNGLVETRVYDLKGKLREQYLGSADTRLYSYDANGNLTSEQSLPQVVQYQYDSLNRLTQDSITSTPNSLFSYLYDGNGNRIYDNGGNPVQPPPTNPVDTSLLGSYDFEGNLSDSSPLSRNGTAVGTIGYLAGQSGSAVKLPGVSGQYIDLGAFDDIEGASAWTIAGWVRMRSLSASWAHVLGKAVYWAAGDIGWHCSLSNCGAYVGPGYQATTPLTGLENTWHHWASVYENNTLSFYLDGALKKQTTANGVPGVNSYTFKLGTSNSGAYPASADLDSLRIYKRALSGSDITTLMTTGTAPIPGSGGGTASYNYSYSANTNRLTSTPLGGVSLDAAGNTLSDAMRSYSYNQAGTLSSITGAASYAYNAQRQRTRKVMGSELTLYHYDLAGNLIAETRGDGTLIRDYVWVDGTPVAQVENGERLTYLHTDHLNTPRLATDSSQLVVWRWEGKAFGDTAASGTVTVNLRFPGQYYDAESGLHYNWNRYYDPKIGRYLSSDPIGLQGGLNTYLYVRGNPLRWTDPLGLLEGSAGGEASAHVGVVGMGFGAGGSVDSNGTICVYGQISFTLGLGMFTGAGANVSGSSGTSSTGYSGTGGLFLEGGGGIAAGTEVNYGSDGSIGGGKGFGGVGAGGAAGFRVTHKYSHCFPKDKGCNK